MDVFLNGLQDLEDDVLFDPAVVNAQRMAQGAVKCLGLKVVATRIKRQEQDDELCTVGITLDVQDNQTLDTIWVSCRVWHTFTGWGGYCRLDSNMNGTILQMLCSIETNNLLFTLA